MATIKLASGEVLGGAKQGSLGVVPFKCWDVKGSGKLLERIQARVDEASQYFVCGPVKGLTGNRQKGYRHSQKTKRKIAGKLQNRIYGNHEKQFNVPQTLQAVAGAKKRRGWMQMSARAKAKKEIVVLNSGHGRPPKLHLKIYGKEVSPRDKTRRDVVKATRVRMV